MSEWIKTKDRLPEDQVEVLAFCMGYVYLAEIYDKRWLIGGGASKALFAPEGTVSHWMPLPEPPESEE